MYQDSFTAYIMHSNNLFCIETPILSHNSHAYANCHTLGHALSILSVICHFIAHTHVLQQNIRNIIERDLITRGPLYEPKQSHKQLHYIPHKI